MAVNLKNVITAFLRSNPDEKFTARGMAKVTLERYPKECQGKGGRSKATATPVKPDAGSLR